MIKVKLIRHTGIVTKWNGEDTPRAGRVGDVCTMSRIPSHLAGYVEQVEEINREFVANPAPTAGDAPKPKRKRRTKAEMQEAARVEENQDDA